MVTLALASRGTQHSESPAPAPRAPTAAPTTPDELIETYAPVARSMAARYRGRGIDLDDLTQVAMLALTTAARRFDPAAGHDFMSYAVPTVRGELRRHFRDCGWTVRPPRRIQELQPRIGRAEERLAARLGRSPRPSEIAAELDASLDEVVEALATDGCFAPTSLDVPVGEGETELADVLGRDDPELGRTEARVVLAPLLRRLSERDLRLVRMRFYDELTQEEIAREVELSQAQVSRILARILADLREELGPQARPC